MVAVVGRLVPHKQVEHAIDAVARAARTSSRTCACTSSAAAGGRPRCTRTPRERGAGDSVVFEGHVEEERKHELYERAWVLALPSLKEGWGLVVGEAGMHSTPAVAYRSAGGTRESIDDGVSGLLVDTPAELTAALARVLGEEALRARLAAGAQEKSHAFTWQHAQSSFALVVGEVLEGRRVESQDPESQDSDLDR